MLIASALQVSWLCVLLARIKNNPSLVSTTIEDAATIVARNPSLRTETYDNIITGKATIWNSETQKLTLRVDVNPINDNYTDRIIDCSKWSRAVEILKQCSCAAVDLYLATLLENTIVEKIPKLYNLLIS